MKKFLFLPALAAVILIAFWAAGSNFSNSPNKPLDPRSAVPTPINESLDLAGGPEKDVRGFPKRKIIDLASMFPGLVFNRGPQTAKKIALTFDDGPDNVFTPQILDVLKSKGVSATFFVMGKRAEAWPDVFRRMVDEQHLIGNHTWNHPNLMKVSYDDMIAEVTRTSSLIQTATSQSHMLFRSPYGSLDPGRVKVLGNMGYKILAWNVDSLDWKGLSTEEVTTNILENVTSGSIILQHSAGGVGEDLSGTVKALPKIIDVLQKEGYQFVTVNDLLNFKK